MREKRWRISRSSAFRVKRAAAVRERSSRPQQPLPYGRGSLRSVVSHAILVGFALMTLAPFAWMVLASFKSLVDVESLRPLPQQGWHPENYAIVLRLEADPITN